MCGEIDCGTAVASWPPTLLQKREAHAEAEAEVHAATVWTPVQSPPTSEESPSVKMNPRENW